MVGFITDASVTAGAVVGAFFFFFFFFVTFSFTSLAFPLLLSRTSSLHLSGDKEWRLPLFFPPPRPRPGDLCCDPEVAMES